MAYISVYLPEFLAVWLGASVLLLDLRGVDVVEEGLFSVILGDFDLFNGNWVQKGRNDLPSEVDCAWSIDGEHLVQPTSVVGAHLGSGALDRRHGDLSDSHSA